MVVLLLRFVHSSVHGSPKPGMGSETCASPQWQSCTTYKNLAATLDLRLKQKKLQQM